MLFAFALLLFISFNISVFNYVIATMSYGLGGGLFQSSLIQIAMAQKKDKQSTIGSLLRLFQYEVLLLVYSLSCFFIYIFLYLE